MNLSFKQTIFILLLAIFTSAILTEDNSTWHSSNNYYRNDVVTYNDERYICLVTHIWFVNPKDARYWKLLPEPEL